MAVTQQDWDFVAKVLLAGPSDGRDIYNHARQHEVWQTLYLATKASPHAEKWRSIYGHNSGTTTEPNTILNLTLHHLKNSALSAQNIEAALKLIANCCADDNDNRRVVLGAGGIGIIMRFLNAGFNPDVVVPTLYNVCADFDEPATLADTDKMSDDEQVQVTRAEELLSTKDHQAPILRGFLDLLQSQVVVKCAPEIRDYLAELVEMAARPATIVPAAQVIQADHWSVADVVATLIMANGGKHLAESSALCRIHVCQAMLFCTNLDQVKSYIARSGLVYDVVMLAAPQETDAEYFGEDDEERKENVEMLNACQTALLKLVYEISQLPDFAQPAQYGVARKALDLLPLTLDDLQRHSSFAQAVGLVLLYGFIDGDIRALLLINEGRVVERLSTIIAHNNDKIVLYPAVALAAKLAVTWNARPKLYANGLLQATQRLLLASDLGFEIPNTAVTFIELVIKGHPEHTGLLSQQGSGTSIMSDLQTLFQKGHEAINIEVGRLFMELCSTLAQSGAQRTSSGPKIPLEAFLEKIDQGFWAGVLVFVATKDNETNAAISGRVWFTLGLLSTTSAGREMVAHCLGEENMSKKSQEILASEGGPLKQNVRYILHNLQNARDFRPDLSDSLTQTLGSLQLGS